ncbi:Crp/Fnr family transcriptional regulator [Sphingomonas sp.]|uniref:Crp/Fnr family transcriptional regulator n=1 Tax=Sphingomonas sp. TaxID=28214 RepID=UPI003CC6B9B0
MIGGTHPGTAVLTRTEPRPQSSLRNTLLTSGFLSREEQRALEDALSLARWVGPNIDLVREGEGADTLFIVAEGWAFRYTTTREGNRQLPALILPGDVGNLDSLMFDRLDYGVRTITPAKIVALPRDRALELSARHSGIARTFTWLGLLENVILSRWAQSLGRRSAAERLAHLLCELSVRLGADNEAQSSFAFPLTQEQIADVLGLTSVHVNRTMQYLRTGGLIQIANRILTIPDLAKLRQAAGFDPRYLHIAGAGESPFALC